MRTGIAIRVEDLGKRYRLGMGSSVDRTFGEVVSDSVRDALQRVSSRSANGKREARWRDRERQRFLWALRNVSFEIGYGEVVGIVGRNGAGKSTLLKILSRITDPTEGCAEIYGRVGSLLEVGTGFHPELSGRENVYLNGAILGMRRDEIRAKFDDIVAFAEIERFIDTPVKRYSSGMYVRLAFAVAAHLEPEILFVDEVLAVGDAGFQKKCLGKMGEIASEGRTVVFVSHTMGAIHSLTRRCLYLKNGEIVSFGETDAVVKQYLRDSIQDSTALSIADLDAYRRDRHEDSPIRIARVSVNGALESEKTLDLGAPFTVYIEADVSREIRGANVTLMLGNEQAHRIAVFYSGDQGFSLFLAPGRHLIQLAVRDLPLAPGQYFADIGINQSTSTKAYDVLLGVPLFAVSNAGRIIQWLERPWGAVHWEKLEWQVTHLDSASVSA
jgi:lipopolysaccharide transport system ATP-binding protein